MSNVRTLRLSDDKMKALEAKGLSIKDCVERVLNSPFSGVDIPLSTKIDWSKVKENEFDSCLYLVRLDGLSDYERLSRRDFRSPESSAQYYNALRLSLTDARGRSRIDVENRIESLLQFIKNGVKFAYLRRDFIERFEKLI